jgi:UDP-N-acetylglucosamine--N-acetylmuramyl-(pentapeptide) pyrophosphoryl-undecaprenol N-acetylglucosamine transferase
MDRLETDGIRVVIAGGGTGGHLYPGLAVASALVQLEARVSVSFAGTARGLEARIVPTSGFALDMIRSAGLKGQSAGALARGLGMLPLSAWDAWRVVSTRRPHVVIGVGGYSSGPIVACAALRGIPTMVLEQNAMPGLTNRLLARLVDAAAVTYEAALPFFGGKGFVSGNPVRASFRAIHEAGSSPWESHVTHAGGPRMLVFGGSQGAHAINVAVAAALPALRRAFPSSWITHQTGAVDLDAMRAAHREAGGEGRVEAFITDLDREMRLADLVVCRAGATTLAELAVAGKAALLVPLPTATDDHQRKNAAALAGRGAASVLDQRELTPERLVAEVGALLGDRARRDGLGAAIAALARPDAADVVARKALALARGER